MRKKLIVTSVLASLLIVGAGMQAEAGVNLGKILGGVVVTDNAPTQGSGPVVGTETKGPQVDTHESGATIRTVCDLPYAHVYGGPVVNIKIEGDRMILSGSDVHHYGMSDESGRINTGIPGSAKQCVIWKSKADHYFTFTKPAKGEEVKLVRHEGGSASIKFEK